MLERPFGKRPDFEHLRRVLMRETADGPVPLLEILADPEIMSEVTAIAGTRSLKHATFSQNSP